MKKYIILFGVIIFILFFIYIFIFFFRPKSTINNGYPITTISPTQIVPTNIHSSPIPTSIQSVPTNIVVTVNPLSITPTLSIIPTTATISVTDTYSQRRDQALKQEHPDAYLADRVPYATANFSVTSALDPATYVYSFAVTLYGDHSQAKQAFINWVLSLGLTQDQINTLSITYN